MWQQPWHFFTVSGWQSLGWEMELTVSWSAGSWYRRLGGMHHMNSVLQHSVGDG